MSRPYWQEQKPDQPLFGDLLWSRPENKRFAGKLLIIGGNANSFVACAEAYGAAVQAGIGTARVLMPNSLQKSVSKLFPEADFAPSTPSGSFATTSLTECLDLAAWADGVLLPGDLGRNSETAVMLEYLLEKYQGQLTLTRDAADDLINLPGPLMARPDTLLVLSFGQLQKLGRGARFLQPFTSDMGLLRLLDTLHEFTNRYKINLVTKLNDTLVVTRDGRISTTKMSVNPQVWRLKTASQAAVWWLQNPGKSFEALTTAAYSISGTAGRT